ncbi:RDD family protein [Rheinheimera riviphila]|uniref:RDD family protein n=1 Tax=Rheinheimera riviphila TaxID=1834037 RepID=A0A437QT14_9GAMM|nr:RDD family protein [Rheinheimera riviphila]RVU37668.1 RDD family protein [Rheinheimera riviphila]
MLPIEITTPQAEPTGVALTAKETRAIITPYAFHVDPELLGVPLASPIRRGVAMAIDGLIVLGLAKASLLVMVPVLAYLVWLRLKAQKYVQVLLLLLAGFVAVGSAEYAPEILFEAPETTSSSKELDVETSVQIGLAAVAMAKESCHDGCVAKELKSVRRMMQKQQIDRAMATDVMTGLLEGSQLSEERQAQMLDEVLKHYPMSEAQVAAVDGVKQQLPNTEAWYVPDPETKSIMEWVNGVLQDLGIGFGWAVFYFTAFVGWTNGQTIGKKLCQIQIVRLDGVPLDLWQAFSRQGGYGAGFATGLLGFLQIFWDPNRQAIQDKGSGTVVIRLNKPKQPLHH